MNRLQQQVLERQTEGDWEGAVEVIRQMASLDPDHPKPYIRLVLLQASRGALGEVAELRERLGLGDGPGRVYGEGMLSVFQGAPDQALERFSQALQAYKARGHLAGQAACHNARGIVHKGARRFDEAVAEYQAAISFLEELDDPSSLLDVHGNLAQLERMRGHPDAALQHQKEILSLRVEAGDKEGQARSWYEIGSALSDAGQQKEAVEALQRASALHRELGQPTAEIGVMQKLAAVERQAGWGEAAVQRLQHARDLAAGMDDAALEAQVAQQLGETLVDVGRSREARNVLEQAVARFRELDQPRQETGARTSLGRALLRMGEYGRARELLQESLAKAEELDDRSLIAPACTNLGNVHLAAGEATEALLMQERALQLYRQAEDRAGERISLNNLGAVYFALGDVSRSQSYMEQTLQLAESLHDTRAVARAHNNLGVLLSQVGGPQTALAELQKALHLWESLDAPRSQALSRTNAAEVLLQLGRRGRAEELLAQALEGFRRSGDGGGEASVHNLLGELHLAAGKPAEAVAAHRRALDLAQDSGSPRGRWQAHAGLAAAHKALKQPGAAYREALATLAEIEDVRAGLEIGVFKMRFLADKIRHYEHALSLLLERPGDEPGAPAESFELVERARARSLVDVLFESGARLRDDVDPELRRRERRILDELGAASAQLAAAGDAASRAAARRRLAEAEGNLERLALQMRRSAPRYGDIVYPRPSTLEEIQSEVLRDDEVLLEYFVGEEQAWVWMVERRQARVFPLPHPDRIQAAVSAFLQAVGSSAAYLGGRSPDRAAAAEVARSVLPPEPLPAGSRLLVVPDGPLHHIPFEALRRGERFLVEDHEIVVAASATALGLMRRQHRKAASGGFLGVADPIPAADDERFPRLPHSREEIDAIAELFPETHRKVLAGEGATKAGLRSAGLRDYRFVHFATHGWLDADDLRHSGLRLSAGDGDPDSALLSLAEILTLDLAAEVVVLSACRSGLGELLRGEGLVGMTRAFLYAGARSVVVSLWNVGDRSTADFMQSFYRGLESDRTPAAALRQAKLDFLGSERADRQWVRRWAPFILVGDTGYPEKPVNRRAGVPTE